MSSVGSAASATSGGTGAAAAAAAAAQRRPLDYVEIQNTIARYCVALDTKDFDLLKDVFTTDVSGNFTLNSPPKPQHRSGPRSTSYPAVRNPSTGSSRNPSSRNM